MNQLRTLPLFDRASTSAFDAYHRENPAVWIAFEAAALSRINSGAKRIGGKALMEFIRWDSSVRGGGEFKINNNFTAAFVRKFQAKYPHLAHYFEVRGSKYDEEYEIYRKNSTKEF